MIVLTLSQMISLFMLFGILVICLMWFYDELIALKKNRDPIQRKIFRCPKCHTSFCREQDKSHEHTARCPNCNNMCYLKYESPKDERFKQKKKSKNSPK